MPSDTKPRRLAVVAGFLANRLEHRVDAVCRPVTGRARTDERLAVCVVCDDPQLSLSNASGQRENGSRQEGD